MGEVASGGGRRVQPRRAETWPQRRRLRKRADYLETQQRGRRLSGDHYLVFTRPSEDASRPTRFGVTVSRKVGGAVVRNKVKRWVRESCRRLQDDVPVGLDIVVVARPSAATSGYEPTARELATLARRLRGK